jgi:MoaA/NifB/PqqE/SkfB family radical SAM enzyme
MNFWLGINSVVCSLNADDVSETLSFARALSVPINFSLVMKTDVCIASSESDVPFEILPEQVPALQTFFRRLRLAAGVQAANATAKAYYSHVLDMLSRLPRRLPCPFGQGMGCLLDAYGDVYLCGASKTLKMGNVLETPLADLWHSEERTSAHSRLPAYCHDCESNCFVHATVLQ